MYLGGLIVFGTTLSVTAIVLVAAALCWRKGYFDDVEAPKYRMMHDGRRMTNDE
jgi:hypothetical protein